MKIKNKVKSLKKSLEEIEKEENKKKNVQKKDELGIFIFIACEARLSFDVVSI